MRRGIGTEVSSIKPEFDEDKRERKELRFKYDTSEYTSYARNGFVAPDITERPDKFQYRFLLAVDPRQGKVQVKIANV